MDQEKLARLAELEAENGSLRSILEKAMDTIESLTEALAESQTTEAQDNFLVNHPGTKLDIASFDQWYSECFSADPTLPKSPHHPTLSAGSGHDEEIHPMTKDGLLTPKAKMDAEDCSTPPYEPELALDTESITRHQDLFNSTVSQLQELQELCNTVPNTPSSSIASQREGNQPELTDGNNKDTKDASKTSVEHSVGKCIAILQNSFSHGGKFVREI